MGDLGRHGGPLVPPHAQELARLAAADTGARQPHTPAWATATEVEPDDNYEDEAESEDIQPYANGGAVNGAVAATDGAALVEHRNGDVLKVSARSRPSAVAGAIAGVVREIYSSTFLHPKTVMHDVETLLLEERARRTSR